MLPLLTAVLMCTAPAITTAPDVVYWKPSHLLEWQADPQITIIHTNGVRERQPLAKWNDASDAIAKMPTFDRRADYYGYYSGRTRLALKVIDGIAFELVDLPLGTGNVKASLKFGALERLSAWAVFADDELGSVLVGRRADVPGFVVDIYAKKVGSNWCRLYTVDLALTAKDPAVLRPSLDNVLVSVDPLTVAFAAPPTPGRAELRSGCVGLTQSELRDATLQDVIRNQGTTNRPAQTPCDVHARIAALTTPSPLLIEIPTVKPEPRP